MTSYAEFIARKQRRVETPGRLVPAADIHPMLHDWQNELVRWAVRTSRAALWADTGMGKTIMLDGDIAQEPPAEPEPPEPVEPESVDDEPAIEAEVVDVELINPAQLKKLSILLREAGFDTQETRHGFVSAAINREIGSAKELTKDEAIRVIDTLESGR